MAHTLQFSTKYNQTTDTDTFHNKCDTFSFRLDAIDRVYHKYTRHSVDNIISIKICKLSGAHNVMFVIYRSYSHFMHSVEILFSLLLSHGSSA